MQSSRIIRLFLVFFAFGLLIFMSINESKPEIAHSQDGGDDDAACTTLIDEALVTMGSACAEVGNNEACYGNILVAATLNEETDGQFETSGDIVDLNDLEALFTQPANPDDGTWGVALMTVQADLPVYSGASVTFVLFGNANIQDASTMPVSDGDSDTEAAEPVTCDITNSGGSNINVRGGPSTNDEIVNVFGAGETAIADARNEAGDWVHVDYAGTDGWLYTPLIEAACDVQSLAIFDPNASTDTDSSTAETSEPTYTYMQAITLESGNSEACDRSPDGLLVRSPEGRRARIVVNGVELTMSSAGFITAQADGDMVIQGLEGSIDVSFAGQTEMVTDGLFTTVPLDGLQADGPPTPPQPVDPNTELPALDTANTALVDNNIGAPSCTLTFSETTFPRSGPNDQFAPYVRIEEGELVGISGTITIDDQLYYQVSGGGWVSAADYTPSGDCSNLPDTSVTALTSGDSVAYCYGGDTAPQIDLRGCSEDRTYTIPSNCNLAAYNYSQVSGGGEGFDVSQILTETSYSLSIDGEVIAPSSEIERVATSATAGYVIERYDIGPFTPGTHTIENTISMFGTSTCSIVASE